MRRLPIYFLIDVSESMVGEQIQMVEEGLATIIKELKSDPYALETVWISIIVFAGKPMTLVPLQEIISFYPPKFPIGSGTSLGEGLGHLMFELSRNIKKTTAEEKGDWKPIIFLFTDGVPTDDTTVAIQEWKQKWQNQSNLVAVSFGAETDVTILKELTNQVLHFKNTTSNSYKEFFKWVTASIKTSSISVEQNGSGFDLAKPNEDFLSKIDLNKAPLKQEKADSNFAIFASKCQNTKKPYLIKYRRHSQPFELGGISLERLAYRLVGAYAVDQSYFELSGETSTSNSINIEELQGSPTCPSCGNQYGLGICLCGKVHCVGNEKFSTCPWCGNQGEYGFGGDAINIDRTQG